jgi:hypothetical protein
MAKISASLFIDYAGFQDWGVSSISHQHPGTEQRYKQLHPKFLKQNNQAIRPRKSLFALIETSVADPDPGSDAFLPQGSGIRNELFPDPGSRIPT